MAELIEKAGVGEYAVSPVLEDGLWRGFVERLPLYEAKL